MKIHFYETIRGVEVEIICEEFDGDPSVGIHYGPEIIYAVRLDDGKQFELTHEETEKFAIMGSEAYYENDYDD